MNQPNPNPLNMSLSEAITKVLPVDTQTDYPYNAARIIVCKAAAEGVNLIEDLWKRILKDHGMSRTIDGDLVDLRKRVERYRQEKEPK